MTGHIAIDGPLLFAVSLLGSWGVYRAWFWLVDRSERAAARRASSARR